MVERHGGARWKIVDTFGRVHRGFPQGLIRFDGTLEAHQVALYLSRNTNVGLILSSPRNCVRGRPIRAPGVAPQGRRYAELASRSCTQSHAATRDPTIGVPPPSLQAVLRAIPPQMGCRNLLFLARYRTPSFSGRSVTVFRPFTLSEPCFSEICRKEIPQGVHRNDSGRSLWELGPGKSVISRCRCRSRARSSPASDGTEAGHTMVPLRPALIIFGNALLRIKVGVGEMDKSNTAGDGALWLFLDEGRRPWGAPQLMCKQSLLPQWIRCGGPHHSRECFVACSSWPGRQCKSRTAGDGAL
jgi:hypothetical protein